MLTLLLLISLIHRRVLARSSLEQSLERSKELTGDIGASPELSGQSQSQETKGADWGISRAVGAVSITGTKGDSKG